MDDDAINFPNDGGFSRNTMVDDLPSSSSMESFFEEILRDSHACTHTHTCNPPGPDNTHTHTCFHTHTKILAAPDGEKSAETSESPENSSSKSKKRAVGNREAVRKYREKKKARTACLEEEVVHLTALNQQLIRRLQGQSALEAEIARLKCLLADFRGRIDGELGSYPYQKSVRADKTGDAFLQPLSGGYVMNSCNVRCNADSPCLHPTLTSESKMSMQREHESSILRNGGCDLEIGHCQGLNVGSGGVAACSEGTFTNLGSSVVASSGKRRKGRVGKNTAAEPES
eukprot:Gb_30625 [translate_table: standard]